MTYSRKSIIFRLLKHASTRTKTMNTIKNILAGKESNTVTQFFCGEYFTNTIAAHPRFEELKNLFWAMETKQYNRSSKTRKARVNLNLTSYTSEFFNNPNLESNSKILALQKEILGDWAKDMIELGFGVSIEWHKVFKSAYESGSIVKTNKDFAKITNLQDVPRY